ncbi:MAG: hypothetical protein LGR52_06640 [Candidatus Thiosymbion ectosymbiont of Robbea hypermnestra]|nr:hypothetical protein [Candidatus Thiosymbion ectosymbiont of Robbea hypermnestra]
MSNQVQKVHSLTGRVTPEVMRQAFKSVKRNRGAAGVDRISIERFEANLEQNLLALMKGGVLTVLLQNIGRLEKFRTMGLNQSILYPSTTKSEHHHSDFLHGQKRGVRGGQTAMAELGTDTGSQERSRPFGRLRSDRPSSRIVRGLEILARHIHPDAGWND